MADEQKNKNLNVADDEFSKSTDKQTTATSGVGDGVDFAESLPGGGSDNDKSSITAGDESVEFDHKTDDDERS